MNADRKLRSSRSSRACAAVTPPPNDPATRAVPPFAPPKSIRVGSSLYASLALCTRMAEVRNGTPFA